jgi:hypothetical protein
VNLDLGVSELLGLRARLDAEPGSSTALGGMLGVVAALDALTWVPELELAAGLRRERDVTRPALALEVALRRYVSMRWSIGAGVAVLASLGVAPVARARLCVALDW